MQALKLSLNRAQSTYSFLSVLLFGQKRTSVSAFILFFIFSVFFSISSHAEEVLSPIQNKGLLLIEKEMIRLSDHKQKWGKSEKANYRALLFLEDYFLNKGITPWSLKVLHKLVIMRDNTTNLRKKAFLDCEAWRVLDYDLKNYENKTLIEQLIEKRKYTKKDYKRYRDFSSDKVASCIGFIHSNWTWIGQEYKDSLYDVKARNALQSVQMYLRVKEGSLTQAFR